MQDRTRDALEVPQCAVSEDMGEAIKAASDERAWPAAMLPPAARRGRVGGQFASDGCAARDHRAGVAARGLK
jgi:hypothetical protein